MYILKFALAICMALPAVAFAESHKQADPTSAKRQAAALDCTDPIAATTEACLNIPAFEATNIAQLALPVIAVIAGGVASGIGDGSKRNTGGGSKRNTGGGGGGGNAGGGNGGGTGTTGTTGN